MSFWKRLTNFRGNPPSYKEALGNNTQSRNVTQKKRKPPPRIPSESEEDEFDKNLDAEDENRIITAVNEGKELARKCALYFADLDDFAVDKSTINAWQRALNKVYDEADGLERALHRLDLIYIKYNGKTHGRPFYEEFSYRLTARISPKLGIATDRVMLCTRKVARFSLLQGCIVKYHHLLEPKLIARAKKKNNYHFSHIR